MERIATKMVTASGQIHDGECYFCNMKIGLDNANDAQITVTDSSGAPGGGETEVVPTNPYDASAMGLNGVMGDCSHCKDGIYVTIEAVGGGAFGGACEVTVGFIVF